MTLHNYHAYTGDLLEANVDAIVHQCNCMSKNYNGLAKVIFDRWPSTNTYALNPDEGKFGSWQAFNISKFEEASTSFTWVINLYAQMYPGKSKAWGKDTRKHRLLAFTKGLSSCLDYMDEIESVAFPKYIGSGLAGGQWEDYESLIRYFASKYPNIQFHVIEKS